MHLKHYLKHPLNNGCLDWMNQIITWDMVGNNQTSIHPFKTVFFWGGGVHPELCLQTFDFKCLQTGPKNEKVESTVTPWAWQLPPRPGKPGIHFVVEGGGKAGGGKDGKAGKAAAKVGVGPRIYCCDDRDRGWVEFQFQWLSFSGGLAQKLLKKKGRVFCWCVRQARYSMVRLSPQFLGLWDPFQMAFSWLINGGSS